MHLSKIKYEDLNAKAKEMYNFQKVAARLADYGYTCMWLSNDWQGADFIAVHLDGVTDLKIQLKGRMTFSKSYREKGIHICFRECERVFLYPHDEVLGAVEARISDRTWNEEGRWSTAKPNKEFQELLSRYEI